MMKIQILAMMFIAALTFGACNDDNDKVSVPENISNALKNKYPLATNVEWEQKGNYLVADCRMNGKEVNVWFNSLAEWQLTETDFLWNDLPGVVQAAFNASEYARWERQDIDKLEYLSGNLLYVIEVEQGKTEYQLFYTADGTLTETKNVTGQDDTHWPITSIK